jgi:hypothetical protein
MAETTVTALELVGGAWACNRADGARVYTYRALAEPRSVADGQQVPLDPVALQALCAAGWNGAIEVEVTHPDGEGGASPSAEAIGAEQLQAVGAAHAALCAAWVGRTVTVEVTSND